MTRDELKKLAAWPVVLIVLFSPTCAILITTLVSMFTSFSGLIKSYLWTCLVFQFLIFFLLVDHNPLNWWKVFWGTTADINSSRIPPGIQDSDIRNWVKESIKGPCIRINATRYLVLRKKDAVMFKLTWG